MAQWLRHLPPSLINPQDPHDRKRLVSNKLSSNTHYTHTHAHTHANAHAHTQPRAYTGVYTYKQIPWSMYAQTHTNVNAK